MAIVLNTKNKAVACLHMANDLCKDVRVIGKTPNPKPWNTDAKVKIQTELIRKIFDILYGDVEITNEDNEPEVACLKIAYDLCDSITTKGTSTMGSSNTDESVISLAEVIKSISDMLRDRSSDFNLFAEQ